MWRPSTSTSICSQHRCRAACVHHWSPDRRAKIRITIPLVDFRGYPRTDIRVEPERHAVPLRRPPPTPPPRWRVWSCIRCGDLLHSNSAATADLLRRVHAPWPVHTGHAIPSCPDVCGRFYAAGAPRHPAGYRGRCVQLQATANAGGGETASRFWSLTSGLCLTL